MYYAGSANTWTKEVRKTIADWNEPTKYSVIYSNHFERHCFEDGPFFKAGMGLSVRTKYVLLKDAVPTIFIMRPSRKVSSTVTRPSIGSSSEQQTSSAFAKRRRKRVQMEVTDPEFDPPLSKSRVSCCVPGCNTPGYVKLANGSIVSFHLLPKDKTLLELWAEKIEKEVGEPFKVLMSTWTKTSRICSRHFQPTDIRLSQNKRKFLYDDAIPSIFFTSSGGSTKDRYLRPSHLGGSDEQSPRKSDYSPNSSQDVSMSEMMCENSEDETYYCEETPGDERNEGFYQDASDIPPQFDKEKDDRTPRKKPLAQRRRGPQKKMSKGRLGMLKNWRKMQSSMKKTAQRVQKMTAGLMAWPPDCTIRGDVLNALFTCAVCNGYWVKATTITECMHTFCRSCILKHVDRSLHCPKCACLIHQSNPYLNLRPDGPLQEILNKIFPVIEKDEAGREEKFYASRGLELPTKEARAQGPANWKLDISKSTLKRELKKAVHIPVELLYVGSLPGVSMCKEQLKRRFLWLPDCTTMGHIRNFLADSLIVAEGTQVGIFLDACLLHDSIRIRDLLGIFYQSMDPSEFLLLQYGLLPEGQMLAEEYLPNVLQQHRTERKDYQGEECMEEDGAQKVVHKYEKNDSLLAETCDSNYNQRIDMKHVVQRIPFDDVDCVSSSEDAGSEDTSSSEYIQSLELSETSDEEDYVLGDMALVNQ